MKKKTYKVLFADDEYWTREKMRSMIPWETYDLDFLEPAADGEDAWEKINNYQPDIFITDINMPFLSGVELLQRVKDKYPEIITFVISGYDDFDYVKNSFLSGTMNYLIKPISKIDLIRAIVKALEKISANENQQTELLKASSIMQDREYSQLIHKTEKWNNTFAGERGSVKMQGVRLILVKIHNLSDIISTYERNCEWLSYDIKNMIRQIFQEDDIIFNNIYRMNEYIILTQKSEPELLQLSEKLRVKASAKYHTCMTICVGPHFYAMESLSMAYVEAISMLMTRSYVYKDEIVTFSDEQAEKWNQHVSVEIDKQLKNALGCGNQQKIKKIVLEMTGLCHCQEQQWSYLEVKQTVKQIFDIILNYTFQEHGKVLVADAENVVEAVDKTIETLNYDEMQRNIEDAIIYLLPPKAETETKSMKSIVQLVVEWIQEHYAEEMSLSALANKYHVDSSYLSKMFSQEMGESLILYITNKRIEKAKEYMKNSEISLADVAFMVGYDDYTYFSRVFKKSTGMNPRNYRAELQGEKGA